MKTLLVILCIVITSQCYAQKASFKEVRMKPNPKYYTAEKPSVIFPVVITKNSEIDKLINDQIKNDVFEPDNENQSLRKTLIENINEYGLTDVTYEITYNGNNFLSFSIFSQGCGAYCSSSRTYFNFDLTTGKKVSIEDVISKNKIDSFKIIVQTNKINSLNKYKIEEKEFIGNDGIDSSIYNWAISEVDDNCINQISIEDFSVSGNSVEIFDPCVFPHAIQSQEPAIELKYSFNEISRFLTPKFKELLR
jgi:hypothetical protein